MNNTTTKYKLLRVVVDVDGNTDRETIAKLLSSNFAPNSLSDYDPKSRKFVETAEYAIYELAIDYFNTFNELITVDIVLDKVTASSLPAKLKEEMMIAVQNMGDVEFKTNELQYVITELNRFYAQNKLYNITQNSLSRLEDGKDIEDVTAFLFKNISSLNELGDNSTSPTTQAMQISEFANLMDKQWEDGQGITKACADYGFQTIDQGVGGLKAGELVCFAGLPGVGKSFIVQSIAQTNAFKKGKSVIYATTENTPAQIWSRMVSSMTGIPLKKLEFGKLTDEELETYKTFVKQLTESNDRFWIVPRNKAANPMILRNTIESLIGKGGLDLLVVDHVNNMSFRGVEDKWMVVEKALQGCKDLALDFQCSVVTPTHLNRKGHSADAGTEAVQYNSVVQLTDHLYMVTEDPEDPLVPPEYSEWHGKPGTLIVKNAKARSASKNQVFYLTADLSVASVSTKPDFKPPSNLEKQLKRGKKSEKKETEE